MTEQLVTAGVIVVVVALVYVGMARSWRRRKAEQADLAGPAAPPADRLPPTLMTDGLYLATTLADQPYERVAAGGLGFRARVELEIGPDGVLLELRGAGERWIPASAVRGAGRATWTTGRAVERDGLVLLGWRLAGRDLDSYFRVDEPAALVAALDALHQKETA